MTPVGFRKTNNAEGPIGRLESKYPIRSLIINVDQSVAQLTDWDKEQRQQVIGIFEEESEDQDYPGFSENHQKESSEPLTEPPGQALSRGLTLTLALPA